MNVQAVVKEITRRTPLPPSVRAPHGCWVEPARVVAGLVEKHWGVSDAVRHVVAALNLHPPDVATRGVRAAFYAARKTES